MCRKQGRQLAETQRHPPFSRIVPHLPSHDTHMPTLVTPRDDLTRCICMEATSIFLALSPLSRERAEPTQERASRPQQQANSKLQKPSSRQRCVAFTFSIDCGPKMRSSLLSVCTQALHEAKTETRSLSLPHSSNRQEQFSCKHGSSQHTLNQRRAEKKRKEPRHAETVEPPHPRLAKRAFVLITYRLETCKELQDRLVMTMDDFFSLMCE
jgi:hypothetical protein